MKKNQYLEENTLSSSYVFDRINPNQQITRTVLEALKKCTFLDKTNIEEQLLQMKNAKLSPLVTSVLRAFESGSIVLVYSEKTMVPTTIPFFITKIENELKGMIFLNRYGKMKENGSVDISYKTIYILMESAYVALRYAKNPSLIERNIGLMKICMKTYSAMAMRIFNKEFALTVAPSTYESINYCFARFFLEHLWGLKTDQNILHNYAMMVCLNKPDELEMVKMDYDNTTIIDIVSLIDFVKTRFRQVGSITVRYYMERYINTYYQSALLSMDALPYLFFVIEHTLLGGFIMAQPVMTDILRTIPTLKTFYSELSKII